MRVRVRRCLVGFALCVAVFGAPGSAAALTVSVPPHVGTQFTATVVMDSLDGTGTASVLVDGAVVGSAVASGAGTLTVADIPVSVGTHVVTARISGIAGTVVSSGVSMRSWAHPSRVTVKKPLANIVGKRVPITVRTSAATDRVYVSVNGKRVLSKRVPSNSTVALGIVTVPSGWSTIRITAANPVYSTTLQKPVKRFAYLWSTCITIDKSEHRLYWVKNDVLVKVYPIAIGKNPAWTPERIWRIDAKYHTSPGSVYGPRKMRLFKRTSSGYAFTPYGIHGTNQPWVIGTNASHGCIRMYNRDVLQLFPQVPLGTMVQTRA